MCRTPQAQTANTPGKCWETRRQSYNAVALQDQGERAYRSAMMGAMMIRISILFCLTRHEFYPVPASESNAVAEAGVVLENEQ
jgi:hypothetical protein